jgi:YD repeat-containing protein
MTRDISRRSNGRLQTGRSLTSRYSAPAGRIAGRVRLISLIICFALLLQSSVIFPVRGSAQGRFSTPAAREHIFPLSYLTARSFLSTVADSIRSLAGKLLWGRHNSEIYHPAAGVAAAPRPTAVVFVDVPVATITSTSDNQVVISWTAVPGAVTYRVERSPNVLTPYSQVTDSSSTTFPDTNVSRGNTFLYRVRAVDGSGNASAPSSVVFGTAVTFVDDPIFINSTKVKADHVNDLRVAVNGVRRAAGLTDAVWGETVSTGTPVRASHVQELRDSLNGGLVGLGLPTPSFDDATLHTGENGSTPTPIRKVHFEQLRTRSRSGSGVTGSGLTAYDFASARLDASNRTGTGGVDLVSRNFNWSIPLVGLPGRSGLDLGLSLSYNSLVWTKSGNYVQFDGDGGNPAPGFRLGFPVVQGKFYDSQAAKNAYLMVTPSGARVELRQTSTAEIYEAVDSSYLQLTENPDASLTLRATDGTRMTYFAEGGVYKCTSIEDANGNLITATYDTYGTLTTITDTVGRTLSFNYESGYLKSITQTWHREIESSPPTTVTETHNWARFEYADKTINTNFTGLTIFGPANGQTFHALAKVQLGDDSAFTFDYTTWGQVNKVTALSPDGSLLNYVSLNLPPDQTTAQSDCPRFTERHDWAAYWNGDANGIPDSEGSERGHCLWGLRLRRRCWNGDRTRRDSSSGDL